MIEKHILLRKLAAAFYGPVPFQDQAAAERLAKQYRHNFGDSPAIVNLVLGPQPGWKRPSTAHHLR